MRPGKGWGVRCGGELPADGHGYRSQEGVGYALWEMTRWLDTHQKGMDPEAAGLAADSD